MKDKLKKVLKGAGIAAGGAVLTYLAGELPNINFGEYTPIIVALFSTAINAALKAIELLRE